MMSKFRINGIGCSLMDFLYSGIDFESDEFRKYQSIREGDGGVSPGRLVFADEFEKFAGTSVGNFLAEVAGNRPPDSQNVGGPCIVALIHAAQMLRDCDAEVSFYGLAGTDVAADQLFKLISRTPLNSGHYHQIQGVTPYTLVLSDPAYHDGKGERIFINHIGAAWDFLPEKVDLSFFGADITVFGGTALVPRIHDHLHELLSEAKKHHSLTVVNTVYDFRNEKLNPGRKWPLGDSEKSFPFIDLLIVDREEALKITGTKTLDEATAMLESSGTGAFIITNGANPVTFCSTGNQFIGQKLVQLPVSEAVTENVEARRRGDTTGCGDNFVGGVLFSIAKQMIAGKPAPDLREAVSWGVVSGGFACFYLGGNYPEKWPGEKHHLVRNLYDRYLEQTGQ